MDKELQVIESLLDVASTKKTISDFVEAFGSVVEALTTLKADTEEERAKLKSEVQALLQKLQIGIDSIRNGIDGADYVLTEQDKREIAASITVPIVEREIETIIEKQPIVTEIISEITKEVPNKDTPEEVRAKIEEVKIPISAVEGLGERLRQVFARGASVAGGRLQLLVGSVKKGTANYLNLVAGSNVTLTHTLVNGVQTVTIASSGSGGGGLTKLTATGTPDGNKVAFVFSAATAQPSYIVSDGVWLEATGENGTVFWTWSSGLKTATLAIPPTSSIFGIA